MTDAPATRAGRSIPWLIVAGVLVAALSLRGPIVAPTPVLRDIAADFGIGSATAGLLTTAPVLMFAVLTPLAALVIRYAGAELALLVSLSGVLTGTFVRALPGFGWMLVGMLVIGASITIGNIVVPVIIRRDIAPERVGVVTAAYVATLNAGSLVTSLLTAPLAALVGWPLALLAWSVLAIAGIAVWAVHLLRVRRAGQSSGDRYSGREQPGAVDFDPATVTGPLPVVVDQRAERSLLRRPLTWLLLLAFSSQTMIYYGLSTWLPAISADELGLDRAQAGALASTFQGVGIVGAFVVPLLARYTPAIVPAVVMCGCFLVLTVGILLAPAWMALWLSFGGIAHAGGFVVIFTTLIAAARNDAEAAGMSAVIQGGGYALGALAAPLMGALHEIGGGWTLALWLTVGLAVAYTVTLVGAIVVARRTRR